MRRATSAAGVVFVVGLLVAGFLGYSAAYRSTQREVTVTVEGKDRVCKSGSNGSQECEYLVFTDEGTFKVTDSFVFGRFSSSDVYGRFREDRTYSFDVAGFRVPVLSMYPNVVSDPIEVDR